MTDQICQEWDRLIDPLPRDALLLLFQRLICPNLSKATMSDQMWPRPNRAEWHGMGLVVADLFTGPTIVNFSRNRLDHLPLARE